MDPVFSMFGLYQLQSTRAIPALNFNHPAEDDPDAVVAMKFNTMESGIDIAKLCLPTFQRQIALFSPCQESSVVGCHVLSPLHLPPET